MRFCRLLLTVLASTALVLLAACGDDGGNSGQQDREDPPQRSPQVTRVVARAGAVRLGRAATRATTTRPRPGRRPPRRSEPDRARLAGQLGLVQTAVQMKFLAGRSREGPGDARRLPEGVRRLGRLRRHDPEEEPQDWQAMTDALTAMQNAVTNKDRPPLTPQPPRSRPRRTPTSPQADVEVARRPRSGFQRLAVSRATRRAASTPNAAAASAPMPPMKIGSAGTDRVGEQAEDRAADRRRADEQDRLDRQHPADHVPARAQLCDRGRRGHVGDARRADREGNDERRRPRSATPRARASSCRATAPIATVRITIVDRRATSSAPSRPPVLNAA